jgi:hypothetical protein
MVDISSPVCSSKNWKPHVRERGKEPRGINEERGSPLFI